MDKPFIIRGGCFSDERGEIKYVNDFHLEDAKRFYLIKHPDILVVRAWQAHQLEKKYFYPINGMFVVAWVKIDNFSNPSNELIPEYHILSAKNSEIISIPKGYANGLKALESNSEVMVFSDTTLEQSAKDDFRYSSELWLDWNKFK